MHGKLDWQIFLTGPSHKILRKTNYLVQPEEELSSEDDEMQSEPLKKNFQTKNSKIYPYPNFRDAKELKRSLMVNSVRASMIRL